MKLRWMHWLSFFIFGLSIFFQVQSGEPNFFPDGPIHEAFMTPSTGNSIVLQAISSSPPDPIKELEPPKCNLEADWISGYWAWNNQLKDFIWVSGVWRKAPQGHVWIPGFWKNFNDEWIWFRGFWSDVAEEDLSYIDQPPPKVQEEDVSDAPAKNYFWLSGHWDYKKSDKSYRWISGKWVLLNPFLTYTDPYYLWRPEGYLYIPGYWDMTLEERGCAYASVLINPEDRATVEFTPMVILNRAAIIRSSFLYYPDFLGFFQHHYFFNSAFWDNWCCVPPWWNWKSSWTFSWNHHWALWWWWMHPGFPQPSWISKAEADQISPPPSIILEWARKINPPSMIFPKGVLDPVDLKKAIQTITGSQLPILPSYLTLKKKIFHQIYQEKTKTISPRGRNSDGDMIKRPMIDSFVRANLLKFSSPELYLAYTQSQVSPYNNSRNSNQSTVNEADLIRRVRANEENTTTNRIRSNRGAIRQNPINQEASVIRQGEPIHHGFVEPRSAFRKDR